MPPEVASPSSSPQAAVQTPALAPADAPPAAPQNTPPVAPNGAGQQPVAEQPVQPEVVGTPAVVPPVAPSPPAAVPATPSEPGVAPAAGGAGGASNPAGPEEVAAGGTAPAGSAGAPGAAGAPGSEAPGGAPSEVPPPVVNPPASNPGLAAAGGLCAANTGLGKGSSTEYPCAALADGRLACFDGPVASFYSYKDGTPVADAWIANGNGFSVTGCLVNTRGAVHCWDNETVFNEAVIPSGALEITGGQGDNCALVDGTPRTVQCWSGANGSPMTVALSAEPTMVSCGYSECCALTVGGAIECWARPAGAPSPINAAFKATWVGTGQAEKCAVDEAGAAYCWGDNWNGQLGLPGGQAQAEPIAATFNSGVVATASGQFHSCFLFADGSVQCTGGGQVNGAGGGENSPTVIQGVTDAIAISVAKHASCALLRNGHVQCWGDNSGGPTPVTITDEGDNPIVVRVPTECQ